MKRGTKTKNEKESYLELHNDLNPILNGETRMSRCKNIEKVEEGFTEKCISFGVCVPVCTGS